MVPNPTVMQLMLELTRYFNHSVQHDEQAVGMKMSYRRLLPLIARYGCVNQRFLVEKSHQRPPTISLALTEMEEQGLITRSPGEDRREVMVQLTEKGKKLDDSVQEILNRHDQEVESALTEEELKALWQLLYKMAAALDITEEEDKIP